MIVVVTESAAVDDLIDEAWAALVQDRSGGRLRHGARVIVTGQYGNLSSRFRVGDTAVACVGVALKAASALNQLEADTGRDQR